MDNSKAFHAPDCIEFDSSIFPRLSEENLLSFLSSARSNAKEGEIVDAKEAVAEIREKYGLSD